MSEKAKVKKPFYKQWWFIVIIVFIALGTIGNLIDGEETTEPEKVETSAPVVEKKNDAKTPDVIASEIIKKKFGSNKEEKEKAVVSSTFENGILNAIAFQENILSTQVAKQSFLTHTSNFMEVMKEQQDVQSATLTIQLPLTDQYGNTENEDVMRVTLSRETLDKINFDGFDVKNLSSIADDYWEHPVLSK